MQIINGGMEHTTSARNKQVINAIKIYQDKKKNISGCLIVTASFLRSSFSIDS
jgi:hypothetical protein